MFPATLDHPTVRDALLPINVEAYQLLGQAGLIPERVELLDGFIVEKMSKSPLHSRITLKLAALLGPAVMSAGMHARIEQPIRSGNSEPEPDVCVVRGGIDDYDEHPTTAELAVEIAVSSAEIDRRKKAIYARAGVGEYWIVFPEERRIEVHVGVLGDDYVIRTIYTRDEDLLAPIALPGFSFTLGQLFPKKQP